MIWFIVKILCQRLWNVKSFIKLCVIFYRITHYPAEKFSISIYYGDNGDICILKCWQKHILFQNESKITYRFTSVVCLISILGYIGKMSLWCNNEHLIDVPNDRDILLHGGDSFTMDYTFDGLKRFK